MDYAAELMGGNRRIGERLGTDYSSELLKPRAPKSPGDIEIANEGDTKGTAGFGTLVKSKLVENPETKIDIFASSRFPGLSKEEARSRYGIINGEVVYAGDDGKVYRETPSGFVGGAKDIAAGMAANAPAIVGGTVGAVAGAIGGPAVSAASSALGAMGGKGYGRTAAGLAFDEPQDIGGNIKDMILEGALSGAGTFIGAKLGQVISGAKARDIAKLDPANVAAIDAKAAAQGVDLNVAQRTNLPSMKSRYDALSSMPTSRDTIAEFTKKQSGQANAAVDSFLAKVSPIDGLDEAGTMARDAAKKVLTRLTEERAAAARPLYEAAFKNSPGIPPAMLDTANELMSRPSMNTAGRIAARIAKDEGLDLGDPKNSLLGMHYMKLALDKMIGDEAKSGVVATSRRALMGLKEKLVTIMDDISPKDQAGKSLYQEARAKFAHMSPNIESVKDGVISRIADLPDEKVMQAARDMFNPNMSPAAVGRAKELFNKTGRSDDWNALLRGYLQDSFNKAGREFATTGGELGQAVRWRSMLMGDPSQRKVLQAAMSKNQLSAYVDMMDVFDAIGRTYGAGAGSQTMPRQEAAKVLRSEAPGAVRKIASSVKSLGGTLINFLDEAAVGKHAEKMAEIMTSPGGMKQLKELAQTPPNTKRFIAGVSALFGLSVPHEGSPNGEQVPQALQ